MHSVNLQPDANHANLHGLIAYLVRDGLLDEKTAQSAIQAASKQALPLTVHLIKSAILTSEQILQYCARQFRLPVFDLNEYDYSWLRHSVIHPELIYRYRVVPLKCENNILCLGITDPTNQDAIAAIAFHTGLRIQPYLVSETGLDRIINRHCQSILLTSQLESALAKISPVEEKSSQYEITENDDGPVSEFVQCLIRDALENQVSDIHIEPYHQHCRIRFRRNGLLYAAADTPPHLAARIITRLKIMAGLNIAERRLPQDGRLYLRESRVDIRLNTCPTLHGEKLVLRILDANINLDITRLGMQRAQTELFLSRLNQPQGLILVTGPTGSGKTVTLYSALHHLNQIEKNISSVEDPVEIELPGVNQININPRIGLDFAAVLRTLLRQDPDIIMVGEIRDIETATIAMQAAQTGHLVLSTLHTNNAAETIIRLQSMGISACHFITSVSLIMAQRLIRKLCQHCKQPDSTSSRLLDKQLPDPPHTIYRAHGCEHCHQGYQGRTGIFELIPITDKIAQCIQSPASSMDIQSIIRDEKWMLLWEAGLDAVKSGITSYAELLRVAGSQR